MDVILEKFDARIQQLSDRLDNLDPLKHEEEYQKLQKLMDSEIQNRNAYKKREDESDNLVKTRQIEQDKVDDQRRIDQARLEQNKAEGRKNRIVRIIQTVVALGASATNEVVKAKGGYDMLSPFKLIDKSGHDPF